MRLQGLKENQRNTIIKINIQMKVKVKAITNERKLTKNKEHKIIKQDRGQKDNHK
jgi:hypothetical protein